MSAGLRRFRCQYCGVVIVTSDPDAVLVPCNLWHEPDGTDHRGPKQDAALRRRGEVAMTPPRHHHGQDRSPMISTDDQIRAIRKELQERCRSYRAGVKVALLDVIGGLTLTHDLRDDTGFLLAAKGRLINDELLEVTPSNYWVDIKVGKPDLEGAAIKLCSELVAAIDNYKQVAFGRIDKLKKESK